MAVLLLIGLDVAATLGVTAKALSAVRRSVEQIGVRRPDSSTTVAADLAGPPDPGHNPGGVPDLWRRTNVMWPGGPSR